MIKKNLIVNGISRTIIVREDDTLANMLRNQLKLTGTRVGCGKGQSGALLLNSSFSRSVSF